MISVIKAFYNNKNIIVYGINPPSLISKLSCLKYLQGIINIDTEYKANIFLNKIDTIEQRVEFSRIFNTKLESLCKILDIKYQVVFDEFLDPNGITSRIYTSNKDHHLKGIENDESFFRPTTMLFEKSLKQIIL